MALSKLCVSRALDSALIYATSTPCNAYAIADSSEKSISTNWNCGPLKSANRVLTFLPINTSSSSVSAISRAVSHAAICPAATMMAMCYTMVAPLYDIGNHALICMHMHILLYDRT